LFSLQRHRDKNCRNWSLRHDKPTIQSAIRMNHLGQNLVGEIPGNRRAILGASPHSQVDIAMH
jgi:hypothetical protein